MSMSEFSLSDLNATIIIIGFVLAFINIMFIATLATHVVKNYNFYKWILFIVFVGSILSLILYGG